MTKILDILIKSFTVLIISIQLSDSCLTKVVHREINTASNFLYPWLVAIRNKNAEAYHLGYGSLIRPNAVVTSAKVTLGYPEKQLAVNTDCAIDLTKQHHNFGKFINCTTRSVAIIFYTNSTNEKMPEEYAAILILNTPFDMSDRINVINLARSVDDINVNNCYFIRWMREQSTVNNFIGSYIALVTASYETSLTEDGSLNTDKFDIKQLKEDRDWIISADYYKNCTDTRCFEFGTPLVFLGSPLFCELTSKTNVEQYGLVGIATFRLWTPNNAVNIAAVERTGSLITLFDIYEYIMKTTDLIKTLGLHTILCFHQKIDFKTCYE